MSNAGLAFFITKLMIHFAVAFGVVIGASLMSGLASVLTLQPPGLSMKDIAEKIKIWAVVAAIGGTIDPIRAIETNFLESQYSPVIKQVLYIASAFIGAYCGQKLIDWITTGGHST